MCNPVCTLRAKSPGNQSLLHRAFYYPKYSGNKGLTQRKGHFLISALLSTTYNKGADESQGMANSILGKRHIFDQHLVTL